jgi:hypothetical protein
MTAELRAFQKGLHWLRTSAGKGPRLPKAHMGCMWWGGGVLRDRANSQRRNCERNIRGEWCWLVANGHLGWHLGQRWEGPEIKILYCVSEAEMAHEEDIVQSHFCPFSPFGVLNSWRLQRAQRVGKMSTFISRTVPLILRGYVPRILVWNHVQNQPLHIQWFS